MRELELAIDDAFNAGLRPKDTLPPGAPFFAEAVGRIAIRPGGIAALPTLVAPTVHSIDWPFPQVFSLDERMMIGFRDALSERFEGGAVVERIECSEGDDIWDVLDFGMFNLAVKDGSFVAMRDTATLNWYKDEGASEVQRCKTMCNFRGQLVGGNVIYDDRGYGLNEASIIWSDIGSISCNLGRKNEAGFRRHEGSSKVLRVMALDDAVVVYGDSSIAILVPIKPTDTERVAPTFGYRTIAPFGIAGKGTVAGTGKAHYFLSSTGKLFMLNAEGIQELGYEEYFSLLNLPLTMLTYDAIENDLYIGDALGGYVYSKGMVGIPAVTTSIATRNGIAYGYQEEAGEGDEESVFVTHHFDFGYRGQKSISGVDIGYVGTSRVFVAADWRMSPADSWRRTGWVRVNRQGFAALTIAGAEFRLCISAEDYDFLPRYAKVRYKMTDMRGMRGVYAPPPRGQGAA